jgi:hypothetical protein
MGFNCILFCSQLAPVTARASQLLSQQDYWKLLWPENLSNTVLCFMTFCTLLAVWRQTVLLNMQTALANREYIANQRPRLVVRELQMLPPATHPKVRIRFVVANSGTSSAEIVESIIEIENIESGTVGPLRKESTVDVIADDLEPRNDLASLQPILRIEPGSHIQYTPPSSDFEHPPGPGQLTPSGQIIHRAPGSGPKIIFRGRVVYIDANGTRRQMAFCREYSYVNENFRTVEDYEYTD